MKNIHILISASLAIIMLCGCSWNNKNKIVMKAYEKGTFGYDLHYLSDKDSLVVLSSDDSLSQVIVSPKLQGKVFTSTASGAEGKSLGFLNYKVFESEENNKHMHGYGGENRLWIGPEGGRYSVFFKPGVEQVYDNWFAPSPVDNESWIVVSSDKHSIRMEKDMEMSNYVGKSLHFKIGREVSLLSKADIQSKLGIQFNDKVKVVAYATNNSITNLNDFAWTKETGTVCIWMLNMFNPGPKALTIIPFNIGNEKDLGKVVTTDYFGEIPADRLKVKDHVLYLKTDGKFRSKVGLNVMRTKAIAGNYDPDKKQLTVTTFDIDPKGIYLNQEWDPKKDPLVGDAQNAYNDGPLEDGSIMGPFFEMESASPAALLMPGETLYHTHNVFHFMGKENDLTLITKALLGVSIDDIKTVF